MYTDYGSHVDDGSGRLTEHHGQNGVDKVEGALEVDCDYGIPLGLGHTHHQTVLCDTGVVDQDVDTAEVLDNLLDNLLGLSKVSGIGSVTLDLDAQGGDFFLGLLAVLVDYQVSECDVGALLRKAHGQSLTDSAGGTGYQGCFSFK